MRKLSGVVATTLAMVGGTAIVIAAMQGHDDADLVGPDGRAITAAEVVMRSAQERALVSPKTALLASGKDLNERRGF